MEIKGWWRFADMTTLSLFTGELDKISFLGLKIWDFSLKSLRRMYGKLFITEVILKHPLRTREGLQKYKNLVRKGKNQGEIINLSSGNRQILSQKMICEQDKSLVAVGYCQKPMETDNQPGCPSGRFNHHCLFLEELNRSTPKRPIPIPCAKCSVRKIGIQALELGLTFYIMTSAADIARDILIPSLNRQKYKYGLFFLCPYSSEAFLFPLFTCRIEAFLIRYQSGNCEDYDDFIAADVGDKPQQTSISPSAWRWWHRFCRIEKEELVNDKSRRFNHFDIQGNMLVPVKA